MSTPTVSMSPYMGRRLDNAWQKGYAIGKAEKAERLAIVALAVSGFALLRGRHVPTFLKLAVFYGLLVGLAVAPVVLVGFVLWRVARWGYRHHRTRAGAAKAPRLSSPGGVIVTNDGTGDF